MQSYLSRTGSQEGGKGSSSLFRTGSVVHVVAKLLRELPINVPDKLIDKTKVLNAYYILTRYPNGFPEGAPFEHFGKLQSAEAIKYAGEILGFVRSKMDS